jgi:RNA polymerase sigma-70 factor (ECF subfamily)
MSLSLPETSSDEALFARFRDQGDEAALDELVRRHWTTSYRLALAVVRDPAGAEDLTQETFIALTQTARAKRRIDSVGPWLRSAVVNRSRNLLRSRRRRVAHEECAGRESPSSPGSTDPAASVREYTDSLPEKLRLPLVLHFGLGYTHAEVGESVGCPTGTASSRIREGLERLREQLAGAGVVVSASAVGVTLAAVSADTARAAVPAPPRAAWFVERAAARGIGSGFTLAPKTLGAIAGTLVVATAIALVGTAALDRGSASVGEEARRPAVVSASSPPVETGQEPLASSSAGARVEDGRASNADRVSSGNHLPSELASAIAQAPASVGSVESASVERVLCGRIVDARGVAIPRAHVRVSRCAAGSPGESPAWTWARALGKQLPEIASALNGEAPGERPSQRLPGVFSMLEYAPEARTGSRGTTSEDDGRFSIVWSHFSDSSEKAGDATPEALYVVGHSDRDGFVDQATKLVPWRDVAVRANELDLGDVVLERLPTVTVVVRAAGVGVSGAKVRFEDEMIPGIDSFSSSSVPRTERVTDSSGIARHGTSTTVDVVAVSADGFAEERRPVLVEGDVSLVFDLVPEAPLAGRVVDSEGRAVSGATVAAVGSDGLGAWGEGDGLSTLRSKTDEQGRFSLPRIAPGRSYDLTVRAAGDSLVEGQLTVTAPVTDVTVTLERAHALAVEVKARERELPPLEDLANPLTHRLWLEREDTNEGWVPTLDKPSFVDGAIRFARLPEGRYRVRFSGGSGFAPAISEVAIVDGRHDARALLELAAGRTLRGRVVDRAGKPVAGAIVALGESDRDQVETAADGTFEVADAPLGEVTVSVITLTGEDLLTAEAKALVGASVLPDIVLLPHAGD